MNNFVALCNSSLHVLIICTLLDALSPFSNYQLKLASKNNQIIISLKVVTYVDQSYTITNNNNNVIKIVDDYY